MNVQIKYYLLAISVLIVIAGCDHLDTRIDTGTTRENLESDYSRIQRLGIAPYTFLVDGFSAIDGNIMAAITDEAEQTSAVSNAQLYNNGSWSRYSNPLDVYENNYAGIRAAYFFLDYSTDYKRLLAVNRDTTSTYMQRESYWRDVENIEFMRAEANILTAWFYFDMIKRYGGVPLLKKVLEVNDDTNLPREDFNVIVDYIVGLIDSNKDHLQANWQARDVSNIGRLTLGTALALKSRILLYAASPLYNGSNNSEKWKAAAAAANDVIQLKQRTWDPAGGYLGTYTITDNPAYTLSSNYEQLFVGANSITSNEVIWAIRLSQTNSMEKRNYPIGTQGGNSGVTPSHNLVSAYEYTNAHDPLHPDPDPYKNRDPRLGFSIVTNNSSWNGRTIETWEGGQDSYNNLNASRTGYYLRKFLNPNLDLRNNATANRSWIVFRYAEILLNYAEAMNEAYGPDSDPEGYGMTAREAVNMVRNRINVGMPQVVAADQTEMRAKIKHERRIELVFEDHRYWDLRRWKDGAKLAEPLMGIRSEKVSDGVFTYSAPFVLEERVFVSPKMYYFPIPDVEVRKSNGMIIQNEGW